MYVLHMNMPERLRDSANTALYGWTKSTNIKTFKCDGDGGGGGSRRLTRSPESDPKNACGRVRGIALLCSGVVATYWLGGHLDILAPPPPPRSPF